MSKKGLKSNYSEKLLQALSFAQKVNYFNMLKDGVYDEEIADAVHAQLVSLCPANFKKSKALMALETLEIYISYDMTGKLENVPSISTSNLFNLNCHYLKKIKGCICEHCFADGQQKQYYFSMLHCLRNLELMCCNMYAYIPFINGTIARIESFGDLLNVKQARAYVEIIEKNKHCFFGWWTKHPLIIEKALNEKGYNKATGKPENCGCILSSIMLNVATISRYWFIDKVFTVYDNETILKNNISINCGTKNCITCQICYTKNNVFNVNEVLK